MSNYLRDEIIYDRERIMKETGRNKTEVEWIREACLQRLGIIGTTVKKKSKHLYSDDCRCSSCKNSREISESDAYDLETCHKV